MVDKYLEREEVKKCPLCSNSEYKFLFDTYDVQFSRTLKKFPLVKCMKCNMVYLKERPIQEYIGNYYPQNSYHLFTKKTGVDRSLRERLKVKTKERLKKRDRKLIDKILLNFVPAYWRLAALFPQGSKILDIGCGGGWKLDLYKEFGWETYGFDISSEAVKIAKSKGHHVITEQVENISYHDNYFDAIQISHVIEHLPNPVFTIKKAFALLKKEGFLLLETPNQASFLAKVFKADFWQIDSPRHFCLFCKKSLLFLLRYCDFKIETITTNSFKTGLGNSLQAFATRKYKKNINIKDNPLIKLMNIIFFNFTFLFDKLKLGENLIIFAKKQ